MTVAVESRSPIPGTERGHSCPQQLSNNGAAPICNPAREEDVAADRNLRAPLNGVGHLAVELVSGQCAATSVCANSPLKILVPRPRGPSVWACLSSFGGGLVAGDEVDVTVTLGQGARCFVGTQASTKVYRNPASKPCGHHLSARLARESVLVLAPDPVQAFAGSSYAQRQEFHLHASSSLVLVDWLCAGRAACGERWAFSRFQSRNEVFFGGDRLLVDSLLLDR